MSASGNLIATAAYLGEDGSGGNLTLWELKHKNRHTDIYTHSDYDATFAYAFQGEDIILSVPRQPIVLIDRNNRSLATWSEIRPKEPMAVIISSCKSIINIFSIFLLNVIPIFIVSFR